MSLCDHFCFTEIIEEGCELTNVQLLLLSEKITKEYDLMKLAMVGLEMDESAVNGHIANNKDIKMAVFHTLKEWKVSQTNARVAYKNICKALLNEKVGMALYYEQILK